MNRSARYLEAKAKIDPDKSYSIDDALGIIKELKAPKFDETVELHLKLGIDVKKADQNIRGTISLPHGIGKSVRVIAFARGDKATAAKEAGADEVGDDDLAKKIEGGWTDFDVAIASPDMMRVVGRLGRILGPQGKMPSPKSGTVTEDVATAVAEFKAGKIEFRADASGNVHVPTGKRSFDTPKLKENIETFINHVRSVKPAATKGKYIQKVVVCTSMGPGIRLAVE
ncbi:MAG TPA: 50S ribosomal protein L1 [Planctomycetota bacterium]|nr:50S ribosomal protein L1 [Planctomycetota bacterium]